MNNSNVRIVLLVLYLEVHRKLSEHSKNSGATPSERIHTLIAEITAYRTDDFECASD